MRLQELGHFIALTLLVPGCIAVKDMASEDDAAEDSSDDGVATGDDGVGDDEDDDAGSATSAGSLTAGSDGGSAGDDAASATSGADDGATATSDDGDPTATTVVDDSASGSGFAEDGSDGILDDEAACMATGGEWDELACGPHLCGLPNACDAIVPACNCGYTSVWQDGVGCVEDDECLDAVFPCGEVECSVALEYCEEAHAGVADGGTSFGCADLPEPCIADHTCGCMDAEIPEGVCDVAPLGGITVQIFLP